MKRLCPEDKNDLMMMALDEFRIMVEGRRIDDNEIYELFCGNDEHIATFTRVP